jgi:predicted AAA+ superfamily ATPase
MIITRDAEKTVEINGVAIEVIPVWKWLLKDAANWRLHSK